MKALFGIKNLMVAILLCLISVAIVGCESSSDSAGSASSIQGTVTDRGGGDLMLGLAQGVTVTVEGTGLSTTTSATGEYTILDVPAGSYTLLFSAGDFTGSLQITVPDGAVVKVEGVYLDPDGIETGEVEIEVEIEVEDESEDETEDETESENEVESEDETESEDEVESEA